MSATDDIKARLDIVNYINQYVPLKKAGRYHKACCPFHSEKTPSFVVNDTQQSWRCFGACSEGGDIFSFAMKFHGWDFLEALDELGKLAGVEVHQRSPQQAAQDAQREKLWGLLGETANAYHLKLLDSRDEGAREALRYAHEARGLSQDTIEAFGIGYAPPGWQNLTDYLLELGYSEDDLLTAGVAGKSNKSDRLYDRFRNRLMVPIRDRRGRVVGFGGRILDPDDTPKYINSPQSAVFDKSQHLFGLDLASQSIRDSGTVVIVEGYMDVITAHQAGFTNVVAQMGTSLTDTQLKLVAPKWARRIVMALDADTAGQNATMRSVEVAREALAADFAGRLAVDLRVLQIPGAKDPDDLIRETPERWALLVDEAMPIAEYLIEVEVASLPAHASIQEREAVARRLLPLLLSSEDNLYSKENVQKLAVRLLISEVDLLKMADQHLPPRSHQQRPPERKDPAEAPSMAPNESVAPNRPDKFVEAYFLHLLFQNPDQYYYINRTLRELAQGESILLAGPLENLCGRDFTYTAYQALMGLFLESLEQVSMDSLVYIQSSCAMALEADLHTVLSTGPDAKFNARRNSRREGDDVEQVLEQITRRGIRVQSPDNLVRQALELRQRRLVQETNEISLLQIEAIRQKDDEALMQYRENLLRYRQAMHRIDIELDRLKRG